METLNIVPDSLGQVPAKTSGVESNEVINPVLNNSPEPERGNQFIQEKQVAPEEVKKDTELSPQEKIEEILKSAQRKDSEPVTDDSEPLSEEQIDKLLSDQTTPKWFREQLKRFSKYTGKLKSELEELKAKSVSVTEQQVPEIQQDPEIELLKQYGDKLMKLSSFTSSPKEIVDSLEQIIPPTRLNEIKNQIAWEFFETPDGQPDLDNLQVLVDRFSSWKEGEPRVKAKDVLDAIKAIKNGVVSPESFREFSSEAEYQAYLRMKKLEEELEAQYEAAKSNKEFQEQQTRITLLQKVVDEVKVDVDKKVTGMLSKYNLDIKPSEPEPIVKYKQMMMERIGDFVNRFAERNQYLSDVLKSIDLLSKPRGYDINRIQNEIQSFSQSFNFKTAVNKGLSDLTRELEKILADESQRFKFFVRGYETELNKGQSGAPVFSNISGQSNTSYTKEELDKMDSARRRAMIYESVSNQLRQQLNKK